MCILLHLVGFLQPRITMHGTTNVKFNACLFLCVLCVQLLAVLLNIANKFLYR